MIYVRPLSEAERGELKRMARREVGRVGERARMVLLSDRRYAVPQIAAIFECGEATVRQWLARFEAEGAAGLRDRPRPGRPRTADAAARATIRRELGRPPVRAGYRDGCWTVPALRRHLAERCDLPLSATTVRRVLVAEGYRWRRPRHCLPRDPDAARKMWALYERVVGAPADAAILCQDECDVHLLPALRAMWMRRGQQARIPTPGTNRKFSVFGALEPATGRWTYRMYRGKGQLEFVHFLGQVLAAYPDRPILLVLDNAAFHTAPRVARWVAAQSRLELLFLPTYSGHEQNPVEKLWWRLKGRVAANRLHADVDALVASVRAFFDDLTPHDALRLAA
jgi:transposase